MSQQLRLLPAPRPLNDRLGAAFFRGLPRAPGVYRMFDEAGRLLYVGQSRDLRDRLNSYRHVHPDRDSRKTVRLVHLVRRIEWEVCDSPVGAVLRENELLRTLRPRFNRMNVYPPACWFIGLRVAEGRIQLTLNHEPLTEGWAFGAFKGALNAFASLGRLLFVIGQPSVRLEQFPARLLTTAPRRSLVQPLDGGLMVQLHDYLAGESPALLETFTNACAEARLGTPFEQTLLLEDLVVAETFFHHGPERVRRLKARIPQVQPWLAPEALLDGLAAESLARRLRTAKPLARESTRPAESADAAGADGDGGGLRAVQPAARAADSADAPGRHEEGAALLHPGIASG